MAPNGRKRKLPSRYGNLISNANFSSDVEEVFGDNSMDDPNFEPLENKRQKTSNVESLNDGSSADQENFDEEFDKIETVSRSNRALERESVNGTGATEHALLKGDCDSYLDPTFLRKLLMSLHSNSLEILTRLGVIEESLLRSGSLITVKTEEARIEAFKKYHDFCTSNNLPMKSIDDVKNFEWKLMGETFVEETVSYY